MRLGRSQRLFTGVLIAAGVAALTGCSSASSQSPLAGAGPTKTEVRAVNAFTKLEVRHGIKLELSIGTPARVELTAQENLLPITTTAVADGTLTVDTARDYSSPDGITVKVTTPAVGQLAFVGGANGSVTGLTASTLTIRTDGVGIVAMSGTADSLALTAKGGGQLDLGEFTATDATVDLAGGVKVTLGVTRSVKGSAVGGVALILRGHPTSVEVSTTGGAAVTQE